MAKNFFEWAANVLGQAKTTARWQYARNKGYAEAEAAWQQDIDDLELLTQKLGELEDLLYSMAAIVPVSIESLEARDWVLEEFPAPEKDE